jgi:hypothetical protein
MRHFCSTKMSPPCQSERKFTTAFKCLQLAENALPNDADINKYIELADESHRAAKEHDVISLDKIVNVLATPRPTGRVPEVLSGQLAFITHFFGKPGSGVPTWSSMLQEQEKDDWGMPFPAEGGTQLQRISLINHLTDKRLTNLSEDEMTEFNKSIKKRTRKPKEAQECETNVEAEPVSRRTRSKEVPGLTTGEAVAIAETT